MSDSLNPVLEKLLRQDVYYLQTTKVPIVTVSATFREDIKEWYGHPQDEFLPDIVFSRAHFSMAMGVAATAWGKQVNPLEAWVVDPTNYVSRQDWQSIKLTEYIGKTIARQPFLKTIKDLIDSFGRNKLPILNSITPPLLHLTKGITHPILSLHIAAGNILAEKGKTVVQVITDPHVREDYLLHANKKHMWFCVFDEDTKIEFLEKAAILDKKVYPDQVVVTGPPIDPRIIDQRKHKHAWRNGPVKLCLTTGGLGTNKYEIRQIIRQLLPELRRRPHPYQLLIYAGTQKDIRDMAVELAETEHVAVGELNDKDAKLRILYHPQIVDANELLISHGFPWADGFITKPSGDMAYDAAAAGCFILTLKEWGVWEHQIQQVFSQKGIAREAQTDHIVDQLEVLMSAEGKADSWIEEAMNHALSLESLFLSGSKNILKTYHQVVKETTT